MSPFWDPLIREPLRKFLLRILIFTEKKSDEKPPLSRQASIFQTDIRIPPTLVAGTSALSLLIVVLLQVGWSWKLFLSLLIFISVITFLFIYYLKHDFPKLVQDDEAMMLLGTLAILFVAIIGSIKVWPISIYLTPIPAASILATLLLHPRLSIILTIVLSTLLAIVHNFSLDCFLITFLGGMAGTAASIHIRSHRDFIHVGATVALANFLVLSALTLFRSISLGQFLWASLWVTLNGFISAVLALGLLPFLESFFSRVTPMKLLELADFNQPLLKRLMVEAPGTYHHSLMMATLAEAAAQSISANPLLCRVGAYYHDIGKLVKPEYFIENQGTIGYNPHQNLAPALSSLVVVSHVKEGMVLARQHKLPTEIVNFIPMHHGTTRIEYFYQQAKEDAQEELIHYEEENGSDKAGINDENFRYPGPKPETKETAILMLADSVEAAARSIDEPTHLRFKDLVEKIVQNKFSDGQFANSPLTFSDLNTIQTVFVNSLTSIYHARIEYPEEKS